MSLLWQVSPLERDEMNPERWQQVKAIFNSAIQYQPKDRATFLIEACSGDASLLDEVESLIRSHEKSGSFIDNPAYDLAQAVLNEETESIQGQLIAHYEVLYCVGRGGMGEVYLAHDRRLNRKVALKLLPTSSTQDADRLARFEHEARAASALNHPNILTIYEIQEINSVHLIATEFVEGETLRQRLSLSSISLSEALNIAIQVADAISAAHKAGIIHRDIKPENIMIRPDGYVKVLDFGLAKLIESTETPSAEAPTRKVQTGSGLIIGTVGYMSPEQARGQRIDARSDIFSLGAVIYEMIAGQKPFDGETTSDVMAAILKSEPTPLSHHSPDIPPELIRIVNKTLRKDREERYQVTKDLLLDLKSLKEEVDFKVKLDRSSVPAKNIDDVEAIEHPDGRAQHPGEIKTAISTITSSLSVEIRRHKFSVALLILLLVALTTGAGFALYKLINRSPAETPRQPQIVQARQITFSRGIDGFPTLSPDGESIAYSSDQSGSFEIYIKQLNPGGGELQLTNDGQQNGYPAWSPDGQRIAYCPKKRGGIWLISVLGGTPKQLTEFGVRPAWSPDGSMIAFQSGIPGEIFVTTALAPSTIWVVPAVGGDPKQITRSGSPRGGHGSPSWSGDSKRIAFDSTDYIFYHVWSVGVDGSDLKKIARGRQPVYSHDGSSLYYTDAGLLRISISPSGDPVGEPENTSAIGPGISFGPPSISPDGKRIVYSANRVLSNLWVIKLSPTSGEPTGPPEPFISDTSFRVNLARFSTDGRQLAFNRWRPGVGADIWIADADGKNLRQITNNPAVDSQASWLPDGRIAFLSDRKNRHMMLWSISLSSGKEEPLLDLGDEIQYAQLSPDGKQVAYNFAENGIINVWTASVSDGQRKQLTFGDELMGFATWSPDGKELAFEWQRSGNDYLMVMPAEGGPATQLTFEKGKSWPHSWSGDGDKIAFAGFRDDHWNIYWISRSTKVQKQLTNISKPNTFVRYPAWSPKGDQIVYEYAELTGNIWMTQLK